MPHNADTLSEVGSQVLSKDPNLKQVKVVFLPQVGFLINLDKRHHAHNIATNEFPELPQDFTFIFTQGNDVYFKNPYMRQLDDEIGDLDAFIKDVESMIVSKLEEDILDCECELRRSFDAIAALDCILAFAGCSSDQKYKRPQIMPRENILGGDCGISIINGRHPLQEIVFEEEFIPNDTFINEKNRVNIITGPNFSGKSCYLRQVGILVYMAQIGCFIPCEKAEISITDQILAKINHIETCSVPQSSFQLDLTQMASIMRRCTQRSLILIDEFGKGTNPASGISVLTAALRKLAKTNCKILCATHFLEIFTFKLFRDNENGIRALQMSVHVPDKEEDNAVPLFKLKNGVANSSAGLVCAKMASVDSTVITRANEILRALKYGNPVKPVSFTSNANSSLQPKAKAALMRFLSTESWLKASVFEFKSLEEKIMSM